MTMHTTPWAMQNLSHSAEVVRQASQSLLAGTGVVAAGDLAVTANGTPNMSVNVAAGSVWIPGTQGSTAGEAANVGYQSTYGGSANFTSQGSYYAYNDASVNLAIAAANGSNPRIDLVVVNAQDAIYSGSNNQILLQVITGTAAASPVAPAIPANCVVLAQIAVGTAVTSITSGNITDTRPRAATVGSVLIKPGTAIVGTSPTSTTPMIEQAFSAVVTTSGAGIATIAYPVPYANGVQTVLVSFGDDPGALASVQNQMSSTTLTGINIIARNAGGTLNSATIRVNVIAVGW